MKKIVLTGAAGRLGSHLREPLSKMADELVSTDIVSELGKLYPGESYQRADLTSLDDMSKVLTDADLVVHFGAIGDEAPFAKIVGPNIIGAYNVWEAAYQNGVRRVVYASSVHAVGMHSRTAGIDLDAAHKPDTFYGLAKCFAEDLASLYWDKRGIEAVCMRIFSCAQVTNARALGTWLSIPDLVHLVTQAIKTPVTKFTVVYGISNNDRCPVDNSKANFLGFRPTDNAEQFADQILDRTQAENLDDPANLYLGGPFAAVELGNSGLASMDIIDDTKKL